VDETDAEPLLPAALPAFDASVAYEMLSFFGDDVRAGTAAIRERRAPSFGEGSGGE
jgi:hypothetical protein